MSACRQTTVSGQKKLTGLGLFYTGGEVLFTEPASFDSSEMFPVSSDNPIVEISLEYDVTGVQ